MTRLHRLRRFCPWLLGLFLLAQAAGVLPLIFDHTFHAFEGQRAVAQTHDHSAPGRHGDHRHGAGDVKDECCAMHHLTGFVPLAVISGVTFFAASRMPAPPMRALVHHDPARIDRPPKTLSLI